MWEAKGAVYPTGKRGVQDAFQVLSSVNPVRFPKREEDQEERICWSRWSQFLHNFEWGILKASASSKRKDQTCREQCKYCERDSGDREAELRDCQLLELLQNLTSSPGPILWREGLVTMGEREFVCLAEAEEILLVEWDELKIEEKTKAIRFWKCWVIESMFLDLRKGTLSPELGEKEDRKDGKITERRKCFKGDRRWGMMKLATGQCCGGTTENPFCLL